MSATTFSEHIKELRKRVFWVGLCFLVMSALAYQYRDPLIEAVLRPLGDQTLVYLTPGGGFSFIFQVTMYAGVLVSAPLAVYHLFGFIKPALPASVRHGALKVVLASSLLLAGGVLFGYYVAIPAALLFLTDFAGNYVQPNLTADSYLSFFLGYVAGLGALFQLPLLLMLWHWISPLTPGQLLRSERFIVPFAFIAAAMITPTPDVLNQAMVAAPILLVYQFGVVAVLVSIQRQQRRDRKAAIVLGPVPVFEPVPVYAPAPEPPEVAPLEQRTPISQHPIEDVLQKDAAAVVNSAPVQTSAAQPPVAGTTGRGMLQLDRLPSRRVYVPKRETSSETTD